MKIFIASDFHLYSSLDSPEALERNQKVLQFLDYLIAESADLFIMAGDIFDLWYDWKSTIIKGYFPILHKLAELNDKGCELVLIAGNHDFWFNDFFTKYLNCRIYYDSYQREVDGNKLFVSHGDLYTSNDFRYHFFRNVIRNPLVKFIYNLLHPEIALGIGRLLSRSSRSRNTERTKNFVSRNAGLIDYAKSISNEYRFIVMGHSHTPGVMEINGSTYLNAGDWIDHYSFVVIENGKTSLRYFNKL